jgi:ribosomal-protein-serine acetyltransferase
MQDPVLLDLPEEIETPRLKLRIPGPGGGLALNRAVVDSLAELRPWLPWAKDAPTLEESEGFRVLGIPTLWVPALRAAAIRLPP